MAFDNKSTQSGVVLCLSSVKKTITRFQNVHSMVTWGNSRHSSTPVLVSPRIDGWETSADDHAPLSRSVEPRWKLASANQTYYPDLGSDASWVWNFCVRFLDVISSGNPWWRREITSVFSGLLTGCVWRRGGKCSFPPPPLPYASSTVQLTCRWSFPSRSVFLFHERLVLRSPENAKKEHLFCRPLSGALQSS